MIYSSNNCFGLVRFAKHLNEWHAVATSSSFLIKLQDTRFQRVWCWQWSKERRDEMYRIFFVTIAPGVPLLPLKPWSPAGPLFPEAPGGPGSPWKPHIHTYVIRCKASSQQTAGPYAVINHSSQQVTQRRNTYILWAIIHLTLWSFLPLFISKLEDRMRPRR